MTNNELQKITDEKERFKLLRKEIVARSCDEEVERINKYNQIETHVKVLEGAYSIDELARNKNYREASRYLSECSRDKKTIKEKAMSDLEWADYDITKPGANFLATIISIFFHERKLYRRKDIVDKSYWNLSDLDNEHYKMLGVDKEKVLFEIQKVIGNSSIENIVYTIADNYGCYEYDRDDERRKPYTDMLKNKEYKI